MELSDFLQKLKSAFDGYDKEIPIITHENPDPDAISAGYGMLMILKLLGLKPGAIYYSGEVSHPQNKALIGALNVDFCNYDKEPFEDGLLGVCVDIVGIGKDTNQQKITDKNVTIKAIVDHHKGRHDKQAVCDVRQVASTASIICEHLVSLGYDFSDDENGSDLATALLFGLKTDSLDYVSETMTKEDYSALKTLAP